MLAQVVPPIFLPIPGVLVITTVVFVGIALFHLFGGSQLLGQGLSIAVQWLLDRTTFVTRWIYEQVVKAWDAVAGPLRDLWDNIWQLSFELTRVLTDVVVHRIPDALSWVAGELAGVGARITGVATGLFNFIGAVRDSLTNLISATRSWLVEVPIAAAMAAVAAVEGFVTDVAVPRLWGGIREAWDWSREAVSGLRLDLALLTGLVTGTVMVAVRTVTRCSEFLRWLCGRPKDTLHALMNFSLNLIGLAGFIAAIEALATSGDAVEDIVSKYLDA